MQISVEQKKGRIAIQIGGYRLTVPQNPKGWRAGAGGAEILGEHWEYYPGLRPSRDAAVGREREWPKRGQSQSMPGGNSSGHSRALKKALHQTFPGNEVARGLLEEQIGEQTWETQGLRGRQ